MFDITLITLGKLKENLEACERAMEAEGLLLVSAPGTAGASASGLPFPG